MSENNIQFKQLNSGSSSNVYKNVLIGKVEAGSTLDVNYLEEAKDVQSRIRIIFKTEKVSSHPISAHPRVDVSARDMIISTIIKMQNMDNSRGILKKLNLSSPVKSDYARDYSSLENIDIKKLSEAK